MTFAVFMVTNQQFPALKNPYFLVLSLKKRHFQSYVYRKTSISLCFMSDKKKKLCQTKKIILDPGHCTYCNYKNVADVSKLAPFIKHCTIVIPC